MVWPSIIWSPKMSLWWRKIITKSSCLMIIWLLRWQILDSWSPLKTWMSTTVTLTYTNIGTPFWRVPERFEYEGNGIKRVHMPKKVDVYNLVLQCFVMRSLLRKSLLMTYQIIKYRKSHHKFKTVMRPKLPNYCPKELDLSLIEACWQPKPKVHPRFSNYS